MEFVAIDVETANPDMASICQIGRKSGTDHGFFVDRYGISGLTLIHIPENLAWT